MGVKSLAQKNPRHLQRDLQLQKKKEHWDRSETQPNFQLDSEVAVKVLVLDNPRHLHNNLELLKKEEHCDRRKKELSPGLSVT